MRSTIFTVVAICLGSFTMMAQDASIETFNAIRLEHSTNQGQYVTLSAPSGVTSYSLIMPATAPPAGTRRYAFSQLSTNSGMTWYATPLGTAQQIPFFEDTETLTGSPNMTWDNTAQLLTVSGSGSGTLLSLSKSSTALTSSETVLSISSTSATTTPSLTKTMMSLTASGSMSTGSVVRGLVVSVTGGATNYSALFPAGNVGVGTSTPNVSLDVDGDIAYREYNYTSSSFSGTMNNLDMDGSSNKHGMYRIGTATSADVNLTGLAGGYPGKIITIYNATGHGIRLKHESSSSSATNRINTAANADVLLLDGAAYQLIYSGIDSRWVVAFSGPGELTSLGNKEVSISGGGETLPSTTASYIQINTPTTNPNRYGVYLADGVNPGQILVIQNKGPKTIYFLGTNVVWDNTTDLQDGESIISVWNGTAWVQVARASN